MKSVLAGKISRACGKGNERARDDCTQPRMPMSSHDAQMARWEKPEIARMVCVQRRLWPRIISEAVLQIKLQEGISPTTVDEYKGDISTTIGSGSRILAWN
jgi:hypothetical protein